MNMSICYFYSRVDLLHLSHIRLFGDWTLYMLTRTDETRNAYNIFMNTSVQLVKHRRMFEVNIEVDLR
jgi:hypothetical protein